MKHGLLCKIALLFLLYTILKKIFPTFRIPYIEGFESKPSELVFYHMDGCGHCKKMKPEWDQFVKNNTTSIATRSVEQGEARDEVTKHGITGFPTLLLLDSDGNKLDTYDGDRTATALESYLNQHAS
tara:strand:- start:307 stop:687 length:381 start_codon:yes stop_codon:yes gene_type:complete